MLALSFLLIGAPRLCRAQERGDANCDGVIDAGDVAALVETIFNSPSSPACAGADVNADGRVDGGDLASLALLLAPPPQGPVLSYFGIASAEGAAANPVGYVGAVPLFFRRVGSGFQIVVEGRAGISGQAPGLSTYNPDPHDPTRRPDLQFLSSRALGDGSAEVCLGGVPAVNPPDFGPQQNVADALNDAGCNFILSSQGSCTQNGFGQPAFLGSGTQAQFCLLVPRTLVLPDGDTLLAVRLRDSNGVVGPIQQMIVRVGNDAPPTFTATRTITRTPTRTVTSRFSPAPTRTATTVPVPSRTPTPTLPSASATPSASPTATRSGSTPGTATRTATQSSTATISGTPSRTATGTHPSTTMTPTRTATVPATRTFTSTLTVVPTRTFTATVTVPPTRTPTLTATKPLATPTRTATPVASSTRSSTPTRSPTRSPSPTLPAAFTPTRTLTGTPRATPTVTPTDSGARGPQITYFGITRADDSLVESVGNTADSVPIFVRPAGAGFSLVIEGKPGSNHVEVGTSSFVQATDSLPDLQILSSRVLGDGSPAVCDSTPPNAGGVPALDPPVFDDSQLVIDTVNDLACRFLDGNGQPNARGRVDACVLFGTGDYKFVDPTSTVQFCGFIDGVLDFSSGDTRITARLRDKQGNVGLPQQIVVRIGG